MKLKISSTLNNLPVIDYRKLTPFQGALKDLTKDNYARLLKSLAEFGWIVPFFIWHYNDQWLVSDGHQRLRVLTKEKIEPFELPYIEIEAANEQEAKKRLLVISSQYGTPSPEGFDEFTFDLDETWLKNTIHFDRFDFVVKPDLAQDGLTDADDVPEAPKEPISKLGDLWVLGDHRLLCGDSLKEESFQRLLGDEKIDFVFTDPPYGVSYAGKNTFLNSIDKGNRIQKEIENDQMDEKEIQLFWKTAFERIRDHLAETNSYYITGPQIQGMMMMMMMMMEAKLPYRHVIIWVKNNHVLGRCDYNYKHEPLFFGWTTKHKFYGNGEMKTSVWEVDKPLKNDLHPTMKPVALMGNAMLNSSAQGDICFDGFSGSGSTLIAAEKTGRTFRGMEIDPTYCDVTVKRWEQFTGKKAERNTIFK